MPMGGILGGPLYPGGPNLLGAIIPGLGPPTPCMGPWRPGAPGCGGIPLPAALAAPTFCCGLGPPGARCRVFCGGGPEMCTSFSET